MIHTAELIHSTSLSWQQYLLLYAVEMSPEALNRARWWNLTDTEISIYLMDGETPYDYIRVMMWKIA